MKRIIITEKQLHSIVGNTINEDINREDNIIELPQETLSDLIKNINKELVDRINYNREYERFSIDIDNIKGYYFEFILKIYPNKHQIYQGNYYNRNEYEYTYDISIERCAVSKCVNGEEDEWYTGKLSNEQISYIEKKLKFEEVDF